MKHLILANWKMSPNTLKSAESLFTNIKTLVSKMRSIELILAAPSVYIHPLANKYRGSKIRFCAQSISKYEDTTHTGSVSVMQYSSVGAEYCIIGHSESGESIDDVRIKTFLAIKHNVIPVVFVGEKERDPSGKYLQVVREQVCSALEELTDRQVSTVIFCYEPVWAVGQADAPDAYAVHQMALYLRKVLVEEYGAAVARKATVLYGGSVNASNIAGILSIEDIDGVAVGRSSMDPDLFIEILHAANKA